MGLRISGHQYKLSAALRNFIIDKIPRLQKHGDYQTLEIVLEKISFQIQAEIRIKVGSVSVTAKQKDADPYVAVDRVFDKVEAQLNKQFDKLNGKKKHQTVISREAKKAGEIATRTKAAASASRKNTNRVMPLVLEKLNLRIFPASHPETPNLSVEEAAEELFFKDENFLLFRNSDTGDLNLVYRRKDGNFAVMESGGPR